MKIALVMVVFRNTARLIKHLGLLSKQTRKPDAVIIVNTGGMDIGGIAAQYEGSLRIDAIDTKDIGPAGGFKEGERKAYAEGYDYIILADDDAFPGSDDLIERLEKHALEGWEAVGGYYNNGYSIDVSNHYFLFKRDVFRKVGFHFAPFFFGSEDIEFMERVRSAVKPLNDERIIVDHPWRIASESSRFYLFTKNVLIHLAMTGKTASYIRFFLYYFIRSAFMLAYLGKAGFFSTFLKAFADFALGKTGRQDISPDQLDLKETEMESLKPEETLFIAARLKNAGKRFEEFGIKTITEEEPIGNEVRSLPMIRFLGRVFGIMKEQSGKSVVLANQFSSAYPPFSIFTKDVYLYEEVSGKIYLLYRNNPAFALLFTLFIVPAAFGLLPPALILFFFKRGYYKKLFDDNIKDDLEFCRMHQKV